VDTSDPLIRELKTARAVQRVQRAIRPIADRADLAILFGSASRGEDTAESDVDILVVTRDVDAVETELARHPWLQPVVMTSDRHMALLAEGGTFAKETSRGIRILERS
jgi:predicted nucleotidyltransferase